MAPEQKKSQPAAIVKNYNIIVRGFKEAWGVLRAISVINPVDSPDLRKAKENIRGLQKKVVDTEQVVRKGASPAVIEQLKMLHLELRVFNELLQQIEAGITSPQIRQFFNKAGDKKEEEVIGYLRLFKSKDPLGDSDIDKIDLVVTELCSSRVGYKRVLKPPFEIEKVMAKVFDANVPVDEYEDAILHEFKTATERVSGAKDIDEIIKNEVIATMRSFKKEVAEVFMNPRVLTATVHYNVALNNKLVAIFEEEEGEIMQAAEVASTMKEQLGGLSAGQKQTADGLIEKIKEIQETYAQKKESQAYNIQLIVEAARQRKAIQESINKLKEIEAEGEEEAAPPEEEGFRRKSVQNYINEIFHGLLRLDSAGDESVKIEELNIDLKKMDPWEKSLFLMDTQSLGEDRRTYEALREAIVVRSKITEEYKAAKRELQRPEVEEILLENIEMADTLDKEIQTYLDTYNRRTRSYNAIDLIKIKSSLSKNLQRLKSLAKMEGFPVVRKAD